MGFWNSLKNTMKTRRKLRRRIKTLEREVGRLQEDLRNVPELNTLEKLEQENIYVIATPIPESVMRSVERLKQVIPWTLPVILITNPDSKPCNLKTLDEKDKKRVKKALEE